MISSTDESWIEENDLRFKLHVKNTHTTRLSTQYWFSEEFEANLIEGHEKFDFEIYEFEM